MKLKHFKLQKDLALESGEKLSKPTIAYHTYGELNEAKDNVVWVCHALTANSDVFSWWEGLVGHNDLFNPEEHYIICANVLGSHYGTTSPLSINEQTGEPYYHTFPEFTIRDIVELHKALAAHLNIESINILIGGSMGGHQALEWAIQAPDLFQHLILLATSAMHSPWGVAFNESQRWAIESDATWSNNNDEAGLQGMKVARSAALLSYRNFITYDKFQQTNDTDLIYPARAVSYQRYQGEKLAQRFNAFSYWHLSKAMDSQNVGRSRGGIEKALSLINAKTLIISIESDILFPLSDQLLLNKYIPNASIAIMSSDYGHDGFLVETEKITKKISLFLKSNQVQKKALEIGV